MTRGRLLLALPLALLLSACNPFHAFQPDCHKPQPYQKAEQVAPLRVPDGLDAPNVTGALLIPPADEVTPPPGPKDACLDAPPRFKEAPPSKSAAEMPKAGGAN